MSIPTPLKRLQAFREKLELAYTDDWKFDLKWPNETKLPSPRSSMPMPKQPSPHLHITPLCSPVHHYSQKFHHHCHPMHFHEFIHPHDHTHNHFDEQSIIYEENTSHSTANLKSPPKLKSPSIDRKSDDKIAMCADELCTKPKKKIRRSKSCPKELFSISSKCSDNEKSRNETIEMNERRTGLEKCSPYDIECFHLSSSSSQHDHPSPPRPSHRQHQHSRTRMIPQIRVERPTSKTPNSIDKFLSSKLVRSNHAAKLRHNSSRKKIHELAEEKTKATLHVSHFIPKCHTWNVRDTPAWKTFLSEE